MFPARSVITFPAEIEFTVKSLLASFAPTVYVPSLVFVALFQADITAVPSTPELSCVSNVTVTALSAVTSSLN